jgi:hypothetical protein
MKKRGIGFSSFIAKSTEIVKSFYGKTGGGEKMRKVRKGGASGSVSRRPP